MADNWAGELWGAEGVCARLAHYPPGLSHDAHTHREPHISVVVAGSFRETTCDGETVICHGGIGFRADSARHAVRFGPSGALILTVAARAWRAERLPRAGVRWVGTAAPVARELLRLARGGGAAQCDELADRLLLLWSADPSPGRARRAKPSAWLRLAADRLLDDAGEISIAGLASELGIHRVHFTRAFQLHYGMPPSVFRRRAMASKAVSAALAERRSLALAAAEAGFADQSHMSRVVREWCAMSAGELRRLFRPEATSVQAAAGRRV